MQAWHCAGSCGGSCELLQVLAVMHSHAQFVAIAHSIMCAQVPGASVHWYGKAEVAPHRKVGFHTPAATHQLLHVHHNSGSSCCRVTYWGVYGITASENAPQCRCCRSGTSPSRHPVLTRRGGGSPPLMRAQPRPSPAHQVLV